MNITKFFSGAFLGIAVITFIFFSSIVSLVTDWWWFTEVGFNEIYTKSLVAKVSLGLTVGVFAATFLLSNFLIAVHSKIPWMMAVPEALIGQPLVVSDRIVKKLGIVLCFVVAA